MTHDDEGAFHRLIVGAMMNYNRPAGAELVALWWMRLKQYEFADVERAVLAHLEDPSNGNFPMTLAAILGRIPEASNAAWPGPEAAWNMAPKDEGITTWVCQEILEAYSVARWSLEQGDMIGARVAFIETYKRAIQDKRGRPSWWISYGNADTQEQRERETVMLIEAFPERVAPGVLEAHRQQLALTTGGISIGSELLRLGSDAAEQGREVTEAEVKQRLTDLRAVLETED